MIVVVNQYFLRKGFNAITLWPFVVVRNEQLRRNQRLLNHERIHFRQQFEMLVLPFYVWYVVEFLIRWLHYKQRHLAYRAISFEKEAYLNEGNLDYINKRSFFGFVSYL